jgi:hypothetical protein
MLTKLGLEVLKEELCLFFNAKRCIVLLFYIDNILLAYYKDN